MKLLDCILKFYGHRYFVGPICLTLIALVILFSTYSANNNFDLLVTFFCYLIIISALILSVAFHNAVNNSKREFVRLFTISFLALIISLMALLFCKTYSFFAHFAYAVVVLAIFAFFTIFKEIINIIEAKSSESN